MLRLLDKPEPKFSRGTSLQMDQKRMHLEEDELCSAGTNLVVSMLKISPEPECE